MKSGTEYRCPLCGRTFVGDQAGCSRFCPLSRGCNLICCPHCGYSFPKESRIYNFFKRLFTKPPKPKGEENKADQ
jgi:hypothetical protein